MALSAGSAAADRPTHHALPAEKELLTETAGKWLCHNRCGKFQVNILGMGSRLTGSEKSCLTRVSRFSWAPEGMCLICTLLSATQNEFIMSITVSTNICCQINRHGISLEHFCAFMDYLPCFGFWDIIKSLIRLWCEKINHACWYLLSKLAQFGFLCNLVLINQVNTWLHWQNVFHF